MVQIHHVVSGESAAYLLSSPAVTHDASRGYLDNSPCFVVKRGVAFEIGAHGYAFERSRHCKRKFKLQSLAYITPALLTNSFLRWLQRS